MARHDELFEYHFTDFSILSSPVVSPFQLLHSKYSTHDSTMHTMACDAHRECVTPYARVKCQAQDLRLLELPSRFGLCSLALVLGISSSVVIRITRFSSLLVLVSLHLPARVPSQSELQHRVPTGEAGHNPTLAFYP